MRNLLSIILKPLPLTVIAIVLLEIVILLAFPALYRDVGWFVFGPAAMAVICLSIPALAVFAFFWRKKKEQQQSAQIEKQLHAQAVDQVSRVRPDRQAEIQALEARFNEALGSLRSSRLGKGALYALPWYIIVGPPGSGKTTMLIESGLNFPHTGQGGRGIKGVGGTRNCDWWFTDEGILLDTAGRYTTEAEDHDEWIAFLQMLYRARRRKPINGVIVAISVSDLVDANDDQIADHAGKIRDRLEELTKELELVFPVYIVFTKCDLMDGFVETFGTMSRKQREQVWGFTIPADDKERRPAEQIFEQGFAGLYERLSDRRLAMMAVDRPSQKQQKVYAFPLQFAYARDRLREFVRLLGQPNPYQERSSIRGYYFTSGTQEGAPIDHVLRAMGQAFGMAPEDSGRSAETVEAKSYFIDELFTKLIFPDQHVARSSAKAERRRVLLRKAGLVFTAAATLILVVYLFASYASNSGMITASSAAITHAKEEHLLSRDGQNEPLPRAQLAMEELRSVFVEVESEHRSWEGFVLGVADNLHPELRQAYISILQTYFLLPMARFIKDDLTEVVATKGGDQEGDYFFDALGDRIKVYRKLHDKDSLLANEPLRKMIETQKLWSWDSTAIGPQRERKSAKEDPPDWRHLGAFIDWVARGPDWQLRQPDMNLADQADEWIEENDRDANGYYKARGKKAGEDTLAGLIGKATIFGGVTIPEIWATKWESTQTRLKEKAREQAAGLAASDEDKERSRREFERTLLEQARKERLQDVLAKISSYDPEVPPSVSDAIQMVGRLSGRDSDYRQLYRGLLENLDGLGRASASDDLAKPLEILKGLQIELEKYQKSDFKDALQAGDYPRILENNSQDLRILLSAVSKLRNDIESSVNDSLSIEDYKTAMANVLNNGVDACVGSVRKAIRAEIDRHWARLRLSELFGSNFPFDPAAKTEVESQELKRILAPRDGALDKQLALIEKLRNQKLGGGDFFVYDSDFKSDLEGLRQLQRALFGDDRRDPVLEFRVGFVNQSDVRKTVLRIDGSQSEITTVGSSPGSRRETLRKWKVGEGGADLGLELTTGKTVWLMEGDPGAVESGWRFYRLVASGKPQAFENNQNVRCEWTRQVEIPGVTGKQERKAKLEVLAPDGTVNVFKQNFFTSFRFGGKVFADQ